MIFFQAVESEDPPDQLYEVDECSCANPKWTMEIDAGTIFLSCSICTYGPPWTWGEWQELMSMDAIPVKLAWEKDPCGCATHPAKLSCDCDTWLTATPQVGAVKGEKE